MFLEPPSPEVHDFLMSYKPKTEQTIQKQREEFLVNKIYFVVRGICKKYPNIAREILDSFEHEFSKDLEKKKTPRFRRLKMLKLTAIRRVRKEVVK